MMAQPVVGIVGIAGAYGRWLAQFLRTHMQLEVIGFDPTDGGGMDEATLAQRADVLIFSAPIRHTATLIERYVELAGPRAASQLWMDVTSIKQAPVAAMLASQAEVVGLHPMTAPPKSPTLKGRMMVVCEARLRHWSEWVQTLCAALQAECVYATPEHHDRVMALVQAMVHATHLVQAGTLRDYAPLLGELRALMPYRSASFELDNAVIARILSSIRRSTKTSSSATRMSARCSIRCCCNCSSCAHWSHKATTRRARSFAASSWMTTHRRCNASRSW